MTIQTFPKTHDGQTVAFATASPRNIGFDGTQFVVMSGADYIADEIEPVSEIGASPYAIGMRYAKSPGNVVVDWSDCSIGSITSGWTISVDETVLYAGRPTLKVVGANTSNGDCTITLPSALFLGASKRYHCVIKTSNRALAGGNAAPFQIRFNYSAGSTQIHQTYAGPASWDGEDWCVGTAYDGDANTTGHTAGTTSWAKVDSEETSSIRILIGASTISSPVTIWMSPFFTDQITPPILSIFMDGNYASQYTIMRHALARANIRASMAIVVPNIGNGASYMTLAQIDEMYENGHECIRHTGAGAVVGWDNLTKYPDGSEYQNVLGDSMAYRVWAINNGYTRGLGCGCVGITNGMDKTQTLTRRDNIAQALYDSGERHIRVNSTSVGAFDTHFEHEGHVPLFKTAIYQLTSASTQGNVDAVLSGLKARGGWSGLCFHEVVLSGATGNKINVDTLDTIMASIVAEVAAGNIIVLPMSEAMRELPLSGSF